jgi:hypothetical protein
LLGSSLHFLFSPSQSLAMVSSTAFMTLRVRAISTAVLMASSRLYRGLVSIAEVHAIGARAHLAQSEPEMTRDRFGVLERHGFVKSSSGSTHRAADTASWANSFLSRFAPRAGFVTLRQTFVRRSHGGNCSGRASKRSNEGVFGEQIWLGVPMRGL